MPASLLALALAAGTSLQASGLPILSYGSDIGLQLGGAAYVYALDADGERQSWGALAGSWTTQGPRTLEAKGELLRLGGTRLRTFLQAKASSDPSAPYWGEGAALDGRTRAGAGSPPAAYSYRAGGPWLSAILRGPLHGALGWWTRLRWTDVGVSNLSPLLAASAPRGVGGGASSLLHAGVVWDTRDRTSSPRRGLFADVSGFASPGFGPLSDYGFGGVDAGVRWYAQPWPGSVLALRALYDLKAGAVPFFERAWYEGIAYGEGLGGAGTVRGLARDRLMGEEKLLAGAELRTWLGETRWLGRLQEWGVSAGVDVGRARDRGRAPVVGAGVFAGGRVLLSRAVVVRLEVGFAGQGEPAYYLSFDEAF